MTVTAARPVIPFERYRRRLADTKALVGDRGLDALLVGVGADLRYLTGYDALPLERLTMLVVPAAGPFRLIVPRLEAAPARGCPAAQGGVLEVVTWEETERPHEMVAAFVTEGGSGGDEARVAVSDSLPALHLLRLQAALEGADFELGSSITGALRAVKDADEVELLRLAAEAADRVVARIAAGRLVGRTEADVAREVEARLVDEGHDAVLFAIVASGPNSASPHHSAGERTIGPGEPVVLDIGGSLDGYCSDITRTLWVTGDDLARGPDPDFERIFGLVGEAQMRATAAVRPNVAARRLDAIARDVIAEGGFGDAFIHRLGHGIGLEGHEDPYLVAGNDNPLVAGMAFSIEPGIYLEGRYGCRLEDIVVCGADGPIVLNRAPHELQVVAG